MIWNPLALYLCTSIEEVFRGKVYQPRPKKKNMKKLGIRNYLLPSKHWLKGIQKNLLSISTIAEAWNLKKNLILDTLESYSRISSIEWDMNTTLFLIGWLKNKTPHNHWRVQRKKKKTRTKIYKWNCKIHPVNEGKCNYIVIQR